MITKGRVQAVVVALVVVLFVVTAVDYLVSPSMMLSIVGIESNGRGEVSARDA